MMVQMTSIIDDYVRSSDFGDYGIQESSVALITFVGANPSLSVRRFVVNVDSNDLSSPKKRFHIRKDPPPARGSLSPPIPISRRVSRFQRNGAKCR
jgi:hypothetical protein